MINTKTMSECYLLIYQQVIFKQRNMKWLFYSFKSSVRKIISKARKFKFACDEAITLKIQNFENLPHNIKEINPHMN